MKASTLFKAAAAASAFAVMAGSGAMLAKSFKSRTEMQEYLWGLVVDALSYYSTDMTMVINELCEGDLPNKVFEDAKVYISTRMSSSAMRIRVFKHEKDVNLTINVEEKEDIVFTDTFEGVKLCWILRCHQFGSAKFRYYDLTFPKKDEEIVIGSYLPFISHEAASTRQRMKTLRLFFLDEAEKWISMNWTHPSTFQTLALDPQVKKFIIDDLDRFVEGGSKNIRGYLLYGPTGTGKSSLVAAMANYLKADVYYLNLSQVSSNSQLQTLLMETTNSSILLVEDIDCLTEFKKRSFKQVDETKVTLSGLLDFMNRGWSNCGDQRIIVFTATNKEKLGSALLRAGRIDVHVHMPYCTPDAFEILASNYLNITTHKLFNEIKESILQIEVSPAEVAEQLRGCGSVNKVLERLVEFLAAKKVEKGKAQEA